ncbi:unnamed protein product [Ilex paraguariensis]|uniref:Knottins-like domain-containing protein n=1 Tax=Ilex paraguariensis TaxID=185542 RepID=A0ABC8U3X3_9AQUA
MIASDSGLPTGMVLPRWVPIGDARIRARLVNNCKAEKAYMANWKYYSGFIVLLLLLLATQEKVVVRVEARLCESQSHGFKGQCWSDHNCGIVCRNEGFAGGHCRGFRRRCFCTRNC